MQIIVAPGLALPAQPNVAFIQSGPPGPQGEPGTPLRTVPVTISTPGQTAISVSPLPVDVNSIVLLVNGISYASPRSFTYSAATGLLTWAGDFDLLPGDEAVLRYI